MITMNAAELQSFRPYHPGELLKEELECREIKQKDFAAKFGLSYTVFNEVLNGKRPVSIELALLMEAALGINADVLVKMQQEDGSYASANLGFTNFGNPVVGSFE